MISIFGFFVCASHRIAFLYIFYFIFLTFVRSRSFVCFYSSFFALVYVRPRIFSAFFFCFHMREEKNREIPPSRLYMWCVYWQFGILVCAMHYCGCALSRHNAVAVLLLVIYSFPPDSRSFLICFFFFCFFLVFCSAIIIIHAARWHRHDASECLLTKHCLRMCDVSLVFLLHSRY